MLSSSINRRILKTAGKVAFRPSFCVRSQQHEGSTQRNHLTSGCFFNEPSIYRRRGVTKASPRSGFADLAPQSRSATTLTRQTGDFWVSSENRLWLRDNCRCPRCVNTSTSQKQFQTCDIPLDIEAKVIEETYDSIKVSWQNDVPGFADEHISTYSKGFLGKYSEATPDSDIEGFGAVTHRENVQTWNRDDMEKNIQFLDYSTFLDDEAALFNVLTQLKKYGLVFIRGAPSKETAVETIANRIGNLRETFYGRTWNVRSVPQAKNVAYTSQFLGFHMDLLYMADPPGFQFLHCLKNSCEGGASMFSDSFLAVEKLSNSKSDDGVAYQTLLKYPQTFHYDNDGEHLRFTRPVVVPEEDGRGIKFVNWSPPFQGPFKSSDRPDIPFSQFVAASKKFSDTVESPKNIYEYKMQEGDCVIFNNRRVLHARREFDTSSGERWLKGTYIDTDIFNSRYRVLFKRQQELINAENVLR